MPQESFQPPRRVLSSYNRVNPNGSYEADRVIRRSKVLLRSKHAHQPFTTLASWKPGYLILRPNLLCFYKPRSNERRRKVKSTTKRFRDDGSTKLAADDEEEEGRLYLSIHVSDIAAVATREPASQSTTSSPLARAAERMNMKRGSSIRRYHDDVKRRSAVFGIFTSSKNYLLQAQDPEDALEWVRAIEGEMPKDEDDGSNDDSGDGGCGRGGKGFEDVGVHVKFPSNYKPTASHRETISIASPQLSEEISPSTQATGESMPSVDQVKTPPSPDEPGRTSTGNDRTSTASRPKDPGPSPDNQNVTEKQQQEQERRESRRGSRPMSISEIPFAAKKSVGAPKNAAAVAPPLLATAEPEIDLAELGIEEAVRETVEVKPDEGEVDEDTASVPAPLPSDLQLQPEQSSPQSEGEPAQQPPDDDGQRKTSVSASGSLCSRSQRQSRRNTSLSLVHPNQHPDRVIHCGYLHLLQRSHASFLSFFRHGHFTSRRRLWLVLRPHSISIYRDAREYQVLEIIDAPDIVAAVEMEGGGEDNGVSSPLSASPTTTTTTASSSAGSIKSSPKRRLSHLHTHHHSPSYPLQIIARSRTWKFAAKSEEERSTWVEKVREIVRTRRRAGPGSLEFGGTRVATEPRWLFRAGTMMGGVQGEEGVEERVKQTDKQGEGGRHTLA